MTKKLSYDNIKPKLNDGVYVDFVIRPSSFTQLMDVADEIKSRLDIVQVIGQTVNLKKAGRIYKGLCPFHSEKTPSFVVYPEQGTWHCFGACGTGGDLFTFVMKKDNLDFGDALRLLAPTAGVELKRTAQGDENKEALFEINKAAAAYYHYLLLHHQAAGYAREYLAKRSIRPTSIESFELGFALNSSDAMKGQLESKGFSAKDIERSGLIVASETGGAIRDRFRGRLMFPIRNRRGQTIGFGARALETEQQPKYLNSPDTPLFEKSRVLYGLDMAKDAIRSENLAVIVEGYTDVIVAHQEGFKNVIAAMGTALTEKQLSQLQRLTKRFALALDADVAGEAATERGLELARSALNRKQVPVPVGPGMLGLEERLDAELLIIPMPEGRDPDEVILQDPAEWRELINHATPLVDYYFQSQTRDLDLKSAHGKSEAVRRLLPIIGEMGQEVQRAHYVQELARLVQIDPRTLEQQLHSPRQGPKAQTEDKSVPVRTGARYDQHFLMLALAQPRLLQGVAFLEEDAFGNGVDRELWLALKKRIDSQEEFDPDDILEGVSDAARSEGERLIGLSKQFEYTELDATRELQATAYRLRLQRDREELTQLQYALEQISPAERPALDERADLLRRRVAEGQRALAARTILKSSPPPR